MITQVISAHGFVWSTSYGSEIGRTLIKIRNLFGSLLSLGTWGHHDRVATCYQGNWVSLVGILVSLIKEFKKNSKESWGQFYEHLKEKLEHSLFCQNC